MTIAQIYLKNNIKVQIFKHFPMVPEQSSYLINNYDWKLDEAMIVVMLVSASQKIDCL